jgi:hypothetical protein
MQNSGNYHDFEFRWIGYAIYCGWAIGYVSVCLLFVLTEEEIKIVEGV